MPGCGRLRPLGHCLLQPVGQEAPGLCGFSVCLSGPRSPGESGSGLGPWQVLVSLVSWATQGQARSRALSADELPFLIPCRGGAVSGRSFEPIVAILLFSCTLALHARQVDVKLRLDYLWAAQARHALSAPWRREGGWLGQDAPSLPRGGLCDRGAPQEGDRARVGGGGRAGAQEEDGAGGRQRWAAGDRLRGPA